MSAPDSAVRFSSRVVRWFDNPVVDAFLTPRHLDDFLELVDPVWTVRTARARIVAIRHEATSTTTLVLRPGPGFRGHRAGQYLTLTVEIAGRATTRVFSIASPEGSASLELTIKRSANGTVSRWALEDARVGQIVTLGRAEGDFVLPDAMPPAFVFIAGGSGVTPIRSLIETLLARGFAGPIGLLVYVRSEAEAIYLDRFRRLASRHPNLVLRIARTRATKDASALRGRFDPAHVDALGIEPSSASFYASGPEALLQAVSGFASSRSVALRLERFQRPTRIASGPERRISFLSSGRSVDGDDATPILERAESIGLALEHGCRRGICHRCACTLVRGQVRNLVTGEIDGERGQTIRPCISAPLTDVEIDE